MTENKFLTITKTLMENMEAVDIKITNINKKISGIYVRLRKLEDKE